MTKLSLIAVAVLAPTVVAFAPAARTKSAVVAPAASHTFSPARYGALYAEDDAVTEATEGPPSEVDDLAKAESLGRGAAKAKRGKRKGGAADETKAARKTAAALTPEETYYEGPPAITETIIPTVSILTVVGIIPAAAAWARQAWVRYKITTRRIRVTSGVGGKDMAEIVYPDIVELRTAKRLFGDGDLVAFLRDGAKFEMRNIPEFEDTIEFILKQVDKDVAAEYRKKGDVTNP
eukprot:CAMPEP_0178485890 /NCGR_PEP_ID=MMETSP0696-20121128/8514_1 /TAXON_ID=265572 /ORGANISM="Extubocellulus spinifer, Strain CCMP396" /LENGTH=234 /DNA_ID=CAMNT_0020113515 /DNA_START=35 /DNA_END=739 /DNA_ORIENTATION=+